MYKGQCHCGKIKFSVSTAPKQLVDCNCSLCHRIGALWGHVPISSVNIEAPPESAIGYVQGDKTLAVQTCRHCGCTTHYESLQAEGEIMAVNFRMCSAEVINQFQIRKFDGADTFQFLD